MSRLFDGVDDQMVYTFSAGQLDSAGAKTLLVVVRIVNTNDAAWQSFLEAYSGSSALHFAFGRHSTGNLYTSRGGSAVQNAIAFRDDEGWGVVATTFATGTSTPRHHRDLIAGAATHTDTGGTTVSPTGDVITVRLGGNADFANIKVAAAAIFNSALADASLDTIEDARTTQSIADLSPFWLVDDSDAFATNLVTPGTGDRSSITGTSDDADDPASWVYGLGAAPSYPSAQLDFARNAFPFIPVRDNLQVGRGRPGRLSAMDEIRGSGPHPYGGFERFLVPRLHPDYTVADVTVAIGAATATGSTGAAAVLVDVQAAAVTAVGATLPSVVVVTVPASAAAALGLAPAPATDTAATAAAATATGSAQQPVVLVVVPVGPATAVGSAPAPTVISGSGATATPAAAVATGATMAPAVLVTSAVAAATGIGATDAPVLLVRALPTAATATGSSPDATAGPTATPAAATATATAVAPTQQILISPQAAVALGLTVTPTVIAGVLLTPASVTVTDTGQTVVVIDDQSIATATVLDTTGPDVTVADVIPA